MRPLLWISSLFEKWIDPFRRRQALQPPSSVWPFFWHYVSQAKWPHVALLVLTGITSLFDVVFFYYMGRLVDILDTGNAAAGWVGLVAAHRVELALMVGSILVGRFLAPSLLALVDGQTIGRSFNSLVMWQAYSHVSRQNMAFFNNDFAGRLVTKVSQAASAMGDFIGNVIQIGWAFALFATTTMLLFVQLDWRMLVLVVVWLVTFAFLASYFIPRMRRLAAANAEAGSALNGRVVDTFSNIQTLKLFSSEEEGDRYVQDGFERYLGAATSLTRVVTGMRAALGLQSAIMLILFGGLAIQLWADGRISVGAVAFSLSLVLRLNMMLGRLMGQLNGLMRSFGVVQNAMETIAQPLGLVDAPDARPLHTTQGEVRFENVSFGYVGDRGVVANLDLSIGPGEKVGLVGRSGAGKSTIVNLLLRFYDVDSGRILIDGQDIARVTQDSLRASIGVATQDTALFHRSVRANIKAGRPSASDEDMIVAARLAEADDFISRLVDQRGRKGYDAEVGERGVKLSGGQRQRIAIARVLLKDAPILVLDEATSALDSEIEAAIQGQLEQLMQGKTVLAIAHRLSTIAALDRLIVLDEGRIVEQGSHADLLTRGGHYARLWARQSGGFIGAGENEAAE
ncbi:MAG TPA: ABC transporter ATP-binding protein [Devosiaceae bacterium]